MTKSTAMTSPPPSHSPDQEDFDDILAAVRATARGRWFLDEFARRNRASQTETLLAALGKIESAMSERPVLDLEAARTLPELCAMKGAVDQADKDVRAVRSAYLSDGDAIAPGGDAFAAVAERALAQAGDLNALAQEFQGLMGEMRKQFGARRMKKLEDLATTLFDCAWRQEVLGERVAILTGLVSHIAERLDGLVVPDAVDQLASLVEANRAAGQHNDRRPACTAGPDTPTMAPGADIDIATALKPENLRFFEADGELFATESDNTEPGDKAATPVAGAAPDVADDARATLTGKRRNRPAEPSRPAPDARVTVVKPGGKAKLPQVSDLEPPSPVTEPAADQPPAPAPDALANTAEPAPPSPQQSPPAPSSTAASTPSPSAAGSPPASPQPSSVATETPDKRIVVIQKSSSEQADIPLLDDVT